MNLEDYINKYAARTAATVGGTIGGGIGAALGAQKGKRLQSAGGAIAGGMIGKVTAQNLLPAVEEIQVKNPLRKIKSSIGGPPSYLKGPATVSKIKNLWTIPAIIGMTVAGSGIGSYLAHGKNKKVSKK